MDGFECEDCGWFGLWEDLTPSGCCPECGSWDIVEIEE